MKAILLILVYVFAGAILGGCATAGKSIPKQIPDALNAACELYSNAKPEVLKARAYAADHWDQIPADWKPTLLQLDALLPKLDDAGLTLCAASQSINIVFDGLSKGAKVDWNQVLTVVMKGATIALELKAKGAI